MIPGLWWWCRFISVMYVFIFAHSEHDNLSSWIFGFCSQGMANVPEAQTSGSGLCVDDNVLAGSLRVELGWNLDTRFFFQENKCTNVLHMYI